MSAERSSSPDELNEAYDVAAGFYRTGDPIAARQRAMWLRDHLAAPADTTRRRRFTGLAEELLGYVFADQGAEQAALEAFLRAERVLAQDEENMTLCGRVRFRLGLACADLGMEDQAEYYLGLARRDAEATDYGDAVEFFRERRERVVDDWEVEADRLRTALHEARREVDRLGGGSDKAAIDTAVRKVMTIDGDLAEVIVEHGDEDAAIDALIRIAAVGGALGGEGHARAFVDYTRAMSALVFRPHFQFSAILEELVPMAEELARQNGGHELRAHARFLAALFAWQEGDSDGALGHALAAVVDGELAVVANRSEALRARLRSDLDVRRDFALSLAVAQNRTELVAELIEGQRLQALPASGATSDIADDLLLGDVMAASEASLTHIVDVSVNGRSWLQPLRTASSAVAGPRALPLETAIRAVGGDEAWWWGTWLGRGRLHWALREPQGHWHCGTYQLTSEDMLLFTTFEDDYHNAFRREWPTSRVWRAWKAESRLARELGRILLPGRLREVFASAHARPLSLVLVGNLASVLALPALGVDDREDVRLVERATLRIQPPLVVAQRMAARVRPHPAAWPVVLACTNPTNDLLHAGHDDVPCTRLLCGEPRPGDGAVRATAANLREALWKTEGGPPGVFFYAGHVWVGGGVTSGLVLADFETVTAGEWFGTAGQRLLPCPERVLLSACDSSGSSGAGAGEWLGLGSALLAAGAHDVVATAWSLPDWRYTSTFEHRLLHRLTTCLDVAEALADVQREALARWRAGSIAERPIVWAAYQYIGMPPSES